ncbi:hypothetical protein MASR2M117_14810 [Paludibacter sp.]
MNRELLVTLIRKNIDELIMLTEGFLEMTSYPEPIINLAKNKTDDIWTYIHQLGNIDTKNDVNVPVDESIEELQKTTEMNDINDELEEEKEEEIMDEEEIQEEEIEEEYPDVVVDEEDEEEEEKETVEIEEINLIDDKITIEEHDIISVEDDKQSNEATEKKTTLAEKLSTVTSSRNDSLAKENNGMINSTIAHKKVEDIRQAISLGDRFRFQRELFKNNGEELNKALSYINKLASYDEVIQYLQNKYGWDANDSTVEDFYQLIKRKF